MRWDSAVIVFTLIFGPLFMLLATIFPPKAQTSAPISAFVTPPPKQYDYPYKGDTAIVYDLENFARCWRLSENAA
jgi:hypothetical protein